MRRATLRRKVYARDRGLCSGCGLDCHELGERLRRLKGEALQVAWAVLELHGFRRGRALWEADHDQALDEGGPDDLENVVTRCVPCHKGKTAEQATRKATIRRLVGRKFLGERPRGKGKGKR